MAARKKVNPKYLQPNKRQNEDLEELVVFGYSCKVFRDDERASYIEEERHLIPWMGNEDITIDRYDGRGHLYDIGQSERGSFPIGLSEEEQRIEALCDEERYLALHGDLREKAMYEEEELKRLNEAVNDGYQAVGFSYDYPPNSYDPSQPTEEPYQEIEEEGDEPFEAPENLKVPLGMIIPSAVKINAIIEKTALFVSQHGAQMEIVLKTKQHNNPQFDFLYLEDQLNPYYKHMVQMMKSGRYIPLPPKPARKPSLQESDDEDEHSHSGYLHPSLAPKLTTSSTSLTLPKTSQIEGTAYAKLLNKLGKQLGQNSPTHAQHSGVPSQSYTAPIQQYVTHGSVFGQPSNLPLPPGMEPVTLPSQPPPPGTVPAQLPITQQGSGHDVSAIGPQIIPPPPDMKPIIDRMAGYVIKEGLEFEAQVKTQDDTRFEFLKPWHTHNAYYEQKKKSLAQEILTLLQDENAKIAPKAISFSIKGKEAETNEKKKKAFLFNESSDEDGEGSTRIRPVPDELDSVMFDKPPPEQMEKKLAEERLKDKLAAAAREKLSQASKEKQMQAERKRKAAMFMNMVKQTGEFKESSGNNRPHSRTLSPSPSPFSPSVHRSSSRNHSRSPKRRRSRSPAYYRQRRRSRSPRDRQHDRMSSKRSSKYRSPSPKAKRKKTPPKAFAITRRSKSKTPPKKRKKRSSSSESDSSSRKKSSKSRSKRSSSRSRGSRSSSRSIRPIKKSMDSRRRRKSSSSSSSSSSSDNEFIKSPSPGALARLGASRQSGLVKALLGATGGEESSPSHKPPSEDTSTQEATPVESKLSQDGDGSNQGIDEGDGKQPSTEILSKVRAMLKASREAAILKDGGEIGDS